MTKHTSIKRNLQRHMNEDYGMTFRDMAGLIHTNPLFLLEHLQNIDQEKLEANHKRRLQRKHSEYPQKEKAAVSSKKNLAAAKLEILNELMKMAGDPILGL